MTTDDIMNDFNAFKNENEEINLMSNYDNDYDWYDKNALFVIFAEYWGSNKKIHIHHDLKHFGSRTFNKWLKKYSLEFEWFDDCVGIIRRG